MAERSRNWCLTINNPEESDQRDVAALGGISDYLVVGREVSPSGTPHLQIYVVMPTRIRLGGVLKLFTRKPHVEKAKGSHLQASDYCKKDGDFHECGVLPFDAGDGEKERWALARESAMAGDLEAIPADIYVRYYRTLKEIAKDHLQQPLNLEGTVEMLWWHGPTGTGKSRLARSTYSDAYLKMANKWWDGYQGQSVVLLEDIDKAHSVLGHHLKIWADRYSFLAETKGGAICIRPSLFVVTSNYSLSEIFSDSGILEPLQRRFKSTLFSAL